MTMSPARPDNFRPDNFRPDGFTPEASPSGSVGYILFSQPTPDRDAVKTEVAQLAAGTGSYVFTGEDDSVQYLFVRAISACGVGDGEPIGPKLRRVAFDPDGALIPDVPNAPKAQTIRNGPGGTAVLTWNYIARGQAVAPASFNIYIATGVSVFNYETPAGSVTPARGNSYTTGAYANGTVVRMVVRAVSSGGDEEPNTVEVSTTVDDTAPTAPNDLVVELIS